MYSNIKTLHKVSVVLRLIDDFNGKLISDPYFSFSLNNKILTPIRKPEGFFVLTDVPDLYNSEIRICSPYYCDYVISDFSSVTQQNPIITARLKPGVNYPLPAGSTAYAARFSFPNGCPAAGLTVSLHAPYRESAVKLKAIEVKSGISTASLTNPYGLDYTGLTLSVPAETEGGLPITFTIIRKIDNNTFEIDRKPTEKPVESAIARRVYSSIANSSGQVLIPIESTVNSELVNVDLYVSDEINVHHENISIKNGRIEFFDVSLEW